MEIGDLVGVLRQEGPRLADAADRAGFDAVAPSCPGWVVRDLVWHVGGVHRWAGHIVSTGAESLPSDESEFFGRPSDGELLDWFRDGHRVLVSVIEAADPAVDCVALLPAPSPVAFWARRQAHETTIHRVDAELAGGVVGEISAGFAVDGIAELLEGFLVRPGSRLVADPARVLGVCAADTGDQWAFRIGPEERAVRRGDWSGDCRVRGSAADLYRLLWNRGGGESVEVGGDRAVLELWHENAHIRWS